MNTKTNLKGFQSKLAPEGGPIFWGPFFGLRRRAEPEHNIREIVFEVGPRPSVGVAHL